MLTIIMFYINILFNKFCLHLVSSANLTPLSPLQPESLGSNQRYLRLERGVQERGGEAPSYILSPSRTDTNTGILNVPVREGDTGGEYKLTTGSKQYHTFVS